MSDIKESLSSLMDGEAAELEVRRVLREMDNDASLAQTWQRYQLTRSVLKNESVSAGFDISDRIAAAIADEAVYSQPEAAVQSAQTEQPAKQISGDSVVVADANPVVAMLRKNSSSAWRSLASMAVAASVTAVVIFSANSFNASSPEQIAAPAAGYALQSAPTSPDLVRAQYGNVTEQPVAQGNDDANVIRLSQGLKRYIDQHRALTTEGSLPVVQAAWMPEGFEAVSQERVPHGEVTMYSDGRDTVSVTVEKLGFEHSQAGAAQQDDMVAVGRESGNHFITVVGNVSMATADKIASNITVQ